MLASSRITKKGFTRRLGAGMFACLAVCGVSAMPASAATTTTQTQLAAMCEDQTFSQVFSVSGDTNFYTLVPGGEFNSASEGWTLYNGARIIQATRPNGSTGGVLDLPSGSMAVSPSTCVTLQYPTARTWVRDVKGSEGVAVAVAYPGTRLTITSPQNVGQVHGVQTNWTLSGAFNVQPQIAGATEGPREAKFVFAAPGRGTEVELSGLYVDPRMR
jgi:hypothetical protein